jgi:hypothetical protein
MTAKYKGTGPVSATFAVGGPHLYEGRDRFMKTPDQFRTDKERLDYDKKSKGGELSKLTGDKSLKAIKPHGAS